MVACEKCPLGLPILSVVICRFAMVRPNVHNEIAWSPKLWISVRRFEKALIPQCCRWMNGGMPEFACGDAGRGRDRQALRQSPEETSRTQWRRRFRRPRSSRSGAQGDGGLRASVVYAPVDRSL